ncbi:hypothetical protein [Dokdonella ginsengisoli]|uniref:Uncharacterized protein n=1 Tax=Dokdonella ginsengisoli TaxID=363846 RepID=A0ABV9QQM4_9GAMM
MIPPLLAALGLATAGAPPPALSVTFPDRTNPNYYNVMTCRGALVRRTRLRVGRDGAPATKNGEVVFRCDGPMTTHVERIEREPTHYRDTDWAWRFESADGREILSGYGAKMLSPPRQGLGFYVREGYLDP